MKNLVDFEPVVQKNDILHIKVTSLNSEVAAPFQMESGNEGGGSSQQNPALRGYLVDIDGNIQFPVLGKIEVAGKTRSELESFLTSKIRDYVTDAVIAVRFLNFRITVLGEVGSPGVVSVENEVISFPELIALSGDISYNGKRKNILVIREENGVKSVGRVDITSADVFKNPYYYLKQNDIVYVEPTYRQVKSAGFITSYTGLISLGTTILSLIILFTR
ncbi:polysaccharide biosynthesis/export family protein [Gillisia sp. M10.2A]|uniref:Polysaccharide biosynthesis/export family protein n=1 Tax=Gillisia lutea TaxID=2909668 RepID=A0ABS9EIJ9_9FLAO|nr:polysaccharide biosynthesis/export family protein [Gillisia lutea]MCF4102683.1 polysaccharide biosynthesis/export family protein [Gillisia lutea]